MRMRREKTSKTWFVRGLAGLALLGSTLVSFHAIGHVAVWATPASFPSESADGLSSVLPDRVPAPITESIDGMRQATSDQPTSRDWQGFLDSVEADLERLYGKATPQEQTESIARLTQAAERMRVTLGSSQAAVIADELSLLGGRLERRIAVLAAIDRLLRSPDGQQWRAEAKELVESLEGWETNRSREDAHAVTQIQSQLAGSSLPAARELAQTINTHYNHYNVRAIVSGRLLDQVARTRRTESGQVRDYVLGADVHGSQTTTAQAAVRLMPNPTAASYILQVEGRTDTQTQSYPRSEGGGVVIHSRGVSQFTAKRRVDITVEGMRAGEPVIAVNTTNRVVDADTPYSGTLLLGGIGRSTAMGEAEARRSQAEAIAAARVRERVLPQFAEETDERIAEMNERYQKRIVERLTKRNAFPEVLDFSTSHTHLFALGRTAKPEELGGHEPLFWIPGDSLATIQLHDSALNNALSRGRLRGDTIDQNSIGRLTAEAEGSEAPPEEEEESIVSMKLSEQDPLRVSFANGLVQLQFSADHVQKNGEKLPKQLVTVRYAIEPLERTVKVVRKGDIELRPMGNEPPKSPDTVAIFRDALELIFLPQFEVGVPKLENRQGEPIVLRPADITCQDGWLSISLR